MFPLFFDYLFFALISYSHPPLVLSPREVRHPVHEIPLECGHHQPLPTRWHLLRPIYGKRSRPLSTIQYHSVWYAISLFLNSPHPPHLSSLTASFSHHLLQTRSPFQLSTNKRVKETGLISPCSSPSSTVPPWANSTWPSIST